MEPDGIHSTALKAHNGHPAAAVLFCHGTCEALHRRNIDVSRMSGILAGIKADKVYGEGLRASIVVIINLFTMLLIS